MSTRVYIDEDYKCHTENDGKLIGVETDFFNGKCDAFIEGYRFIPDGESWTREDGVVFTGEMISPWKPFDELDAKQRQYEQEQIVDMQAALELLGVSVDG